MQSKEHWNRVYTTKSPESVSWYQERPGLSLRLIGETAAPLSASIIDVGGGASTLAGDLLEEGYSALTVLDLSAAALAESRKRLGPRAGEVQWIEADITSAALPAAAYDLWHDRAVFHFLTSKEERKAYVGTMLHSLRPGGHLIVATFADDGPTKCSGLPVVRYSPDELHAEFGAEFTLLKHEKEEHHTPFGTVQNFIYCCFRKSGDHHLP